MKLFILKWGGHPFLVAISSDFRMGQHRDADHQEDAPNFSFDYLLSVVIKSI